MRKAERAMALVLHRIVSCAAGLLLALVPQAESGAQTQILRGPDAGEVRALVVGIDEYRHVPKLKGAVADALDIDGALRRVGVRDIIKLTDSQVNRAALLQEFERLLQRTRAGDFIILTIAGHGAQEPERVRGSQPDNLDKVFLLPNFSPKTPEGAREKILGQEFNHLIKQFEGRGARVMFVADTCYAGGLTREVDPRAGELSYRQVPRYVIAVEDLKPISTTKDAFLTELDFEKTAFLAAVDRYTKAPEVHIPGVAGMRGALSYALARAIEGGADADKDGKSTLKELFSHVRQVVYQLSDQRQNAVTMNSPSRKIETDVAFQLTRAVTIVDAAPAPKASGTAPAEPAAHSASLAPKPTAAVTAPVRIASLDGQASRLSGVTQLEAPFTIVSPRDNPDLVWDPKARDVLAGGDVIAYGAEQADLPSIIDRAAAIRAFKVKATKSPQTVRIRPTDKLHRRGARIEIEVSDVAGRSMIMFNIAGDGTVQTLYPVGSDPAVLKTSTYRFPVQVREPFGADQIVVITSEQRLSALEQVMRQLDRRRSPMQVLRMVERYGPSDARIGSIGLFTAR
jgi:hypothetical protein